MCICRAILERIAFLDLQRCERLIVVCVIFLCNTCANYVFFD